MLQKRNATKTVNVKCKRKIRKQLDQYEKLVVRIFGNTKV
jgi:hypothetical protein